jgi:hypothetical protein
LQIEEGALAKFEKINLEDGVGHPLENYIEAWQMELWEHGFFGFFKGKDSYSKTKAFGDHKHTDLAIKRVIFKYFCPQCSQSLPFLCPLIL